MSKSWTNWTRTAAIALLMSWFAIEAGAEARAVKSRVPPVYPEIARRMKITGVVRVEATIDPDGKVTGVKTITGNRALSVAAEEAVRKWKFASAADQSTESVDIKFELAQ